MKKKIIGGVTAVLAGVGLYKLVSAQRDGDQSIAREKWTAANMPDLAGKVIIVTGANSDIGFEAAKEFARKGAQTVLACRSRDKAQAALAEIQAEIPNAPAEIMELDLASLDSVHQIVDAVSHLLPRPGRGMALRWVFRHNMRSPLPCNSNFWQPDTVFPKGVSHDHSLHNRQTPLQN